MHWVKDACTQPNSKANREFYDFSHIAFADVDVDNDGKINAREFDLLCAKTTAVPRRHGYAPARGAEHGGTIEKRTVARKAMFDAVDGEQGAARGWIGAAQFTDWATELLAGRISELFPFFHAANYFDANLLKAIEAEVTKNNSCEYAGLYELLQAAFVGSDSP